MSPGENILSPKILPLTIALLFALAVLPAQGGEKLVLDGSSGMLPLARALATAYQQQSSDPRVEIGKGLGTGARLQALAEGKIQIALASHGIKPEDVQKGDLKILEVAKGAIVFAVNASVLITNITEAQVCDIYSGKVQSWQALGGSASPIAVLTRPPTEVDPEVIRAKVGCFQELKEVETAKVMARGGDMAKGLAETPHAIGMTSMTVVEQSAGQVKALTLNGVVSTAENVKNGRYFLTRDFLFVIKGEPTPSIKKFLDFVLSPDGDRVILANGAVPLR
ncbi:MAG: phosphate ABC transporter substrate-binding protein [Candidatus Entotheonellia bacterium]